MTARTRICDGCGGRSVDFERAGEPLQRRLTALCPRPASSRSRTWAAEAAAGSAVVSTPQDATDRRPPTCARPHGIARRPIQRTTPCSRSGCPTRSRNCRRQACGRPRSGQEPEPDDRRRRPGRLGRRAREGRPGVWDNIEARLEAACVAANQVQAVWLKEPDRRRGPPLPARCEGAASRPAGDHPRHAGSLPEPPPRLPLESNVRRLCGHRSQPGARRLRQRLWVRGVIQERMAAKIKGPWLAWARISDRRSPRTQRRARVELRRRCR